MLLQSPYPLHLTYCTNIHPAHGWNEVLAQLNTYAVPLKQALSPDKPFGLGLRLSNDECNELMQLETRMAFRDWLKQHDMYVFTMNGFPYGSFHGGVVKEQVHAPDWTTEQRLTYTSKLSYIISSLNDFATYESGISTSPLSYKAWCNTEDNSFWEFLVQQFVYLVLDLDATYQNTGQVVHVDIEPEPDGLLETSTDLVNFYKDWLLPLGSTLLAEALGSTIERAEELLLHHIRVCYDTCHVGVKYEDAAEVLASYDALGIKVGKVQISSALQVKFTKDNYKEQLSALQPFEESTYLHQVVERRNDGSLRSYTDLPIAFEQFEKDAVQEWRIHYHVPIFSKAFGSLGSTQSDILSLFQQLSQRQVGTHFEIETYTWDVLPGELKQPLLESIQREYEWVLQALSNPATQG